MKLLPQGKSFLPEWPKATSGKNLDFPSGNNFIPTQAIGQESYSYDFPSRESNDFTKNCAKMT